MIVVLDNEVKPDYRYLGPEVCHFLRDVEYRVYEEFDEDATVSDYDGVILTGSTASVYDPAHTDWVRKQSALVRSCIEKELPLLGICFGHQLVNQALGGTVEQDRRRSTFVTMDRIADDQILNGVKPSVPVLHSDLVTEPGEDLETIARTEYNEHFCTRHTSAPVWTVQFHPEFTERVEDRPSDWNPGSTSFDQSTATRVLTNFENICTGAA